VGAIAASYISMWLVDCFGKLAMILPFASLALLAAFVTLVFLPETKGLPLPETIEEVEGADGEGRKPLEMQPLSAAGGASPELKAAGEKGEKSS